MTLSDIRALLSDAGIADSDFEARALIGRFCGVTAAQIYADPLRDYASDELEKAVERRCGREPLQYIFGDVYFFGERYKVTPDVLIPRSDTEVIVERAIKELPRGSHFADLCAGSGCIGISILAHRQDTTALLADISPEALAICRENAVMNCVSERAEFAVRDVKLGIGDRVFDAIISNPPYIRHDVIPTLEEELMHEPRIALDGGSDGLDFYRAIISRWMPAIKEDGFFLFEIGYDQGDAIRQIGKESGLNCEVFCDLGGRDRGAYLTREKH